MKQRDIILFFFTVTTVQWTKTEKKGEQCKNILLDRCVVLNSNGMAGRTRLWRTWKVVFPQLALDTEWYFKVDSREYFSCLLGAGKRAV